MRVGLSLIAKNEAERLPTLLASCIDSFDRIVLLDTGSTDATIDVFATWAKQEKVRNPNFDFQVAKYEWKDDFADARNTADSLLLWGSPGAMSHTPLVDWKVWADCDDVIVGAQNIRSIAENASADVATFFCGYNYAQHPETGQNICYLWRERITRATYGKWEGRVHEAIPIQAPAQRVQPGMVEWVHRKDGEQSGQSNERNLRILHKWNADEPDNTRIVAYLGTEYAIRGKHDEACMYFAQYLTLGSKWDEERCQVHRKYAQSLLMTDHADQAYNVAFEALKVLPDWPDNYLTLAEVCLERQEFDKALAWAKRAMDIGHPETMLIVNPLDYTGHPLKLMALALGYKGDFDGALAMGQRALSLMPGDPALIHEMQQWQNIGKREHTANTICLLAEQLIGHDEQMKAKILLEQCVPYFAYEHPRVVQMRTFVRSRLLWIDSPEAFEDHYETGGSKPEDFISDERVDPLCEYLPRTNFLLDGLMEQNENG
jgi:tetratricopeptide (TPR) repeat protein